MQAYLGHMPENLFFRKTTFYKTVKITTDENEKQIISCNSVAFEQNYISIGDESGY